MHQEGRHANRSKLETNMFAQSGLSQCTYSSHFWLRARACADLTHHLLHHDGILWISPVPVSYILPWFNDIFCSTKSYDILWWDRIPPCKEVGIPTSTQWFQSLRFFSPITCWSEKMQPMETLGDLPFDSFPRHKLKTLTQQSTLIVKEKFDESRQRPSLPQHNSI